MNVKIKVNKNTKLYLTEVKMEAKFKDMNLKDEKC